MKWNSMVFVAGWLALSGGFPYAVAAQCQPPSAEEIAAERSTLFAEADSDGNGVLSQEEFISFMELRKATRAAHMFTCLDTNGDGQVSTEELATQPPWGGPHPPMPF